MIVLVHNAQQLTRVYRADTAIDFSVTKTIGSELYRLAQQFPEETLVWCREEVWSTVNWEYIATASVSPRIMASYHPQGNYFPPALGYVEESPFVAVNKSVKYPTWQMNSTIGFIAATVVLQTESDFWEQKQSFDYVLNAVAKTYQPLGLFGYSDPRLLKEKVSLAPVQATTTEWFVFVKQQYKWVWMFLLVLNVWLYEKRFLIVPFVRALCKPKRKIEGRTLQFEETLPDYSKEEESIDVIIPTIGRPQYLYDVLCDLREQTHLPERVVIVEQNPVPDSVSQLDYITLETWPFEIKHIFTHQTGACQARNKALALVKSKWCFLNDDDNRFDADLLEKAIRYLKGYNVGAVSTFYPTKKEKQRFLITSQTTIFGSGNTFIKASVLEKVSFDLNLEFGYGEDTDFGLQLRNAGFDVIYEPSLRINHLKAPMGGFRTKFVHPWEKETIQPKPSPTVMYMKLKHYTKEELLGYKTNLFLKTYGLNLLKVSRFRNQWKVSLHWAKKWQHEN